MKKRLLTVLIGVVLILMLVNPVSAAKPAAVLPGGVGAGALFHWRYQASVTASQSYYWVWEELAKDIMLATGGRLLIDMLPTGSLCQASEAIDAVLTGSVEMTSS